MNSFAPCVYFFFLGTISSSVRSSKILFVSAPSVDSHRKSLYPLAKRLGQRGHDVTILMEGVTGKTKKPEASEHQFVQYRIPMITMPNFDERESELKKRVWSMKFSSPITAFVPWKYLSEVTVAFVEQKKSEFDRIVHTKWDLIFVDALFTPGGMLIGLMNNASWVPFHTTTPPLSDDWRFPAPRPWSYVPTLLLPKPEYDPRNFWDRFETLGTNIIEIFSSYFFDFFVIKRLFAKFDHRIGFYTFNRNANFAFSAFPPDMDNVRPTTFSAINCGGKYDDSEVGLPCEIRNFVQDPKSMGTILVAFGHSVKWSNAPLELKYDFTRALNRLVDYRIIWQFDGDLNDLTLGKHIRCMTWIPQRALLRHPKTKLFVSHGGIKSITEAINAVVPTLVIPFFAEQIRNAYLLKKSGSGDILSKFYLTDENKIVAAMHRILNNASYSSSIKKLQLFSNDKPMNLLDFGVFWTEFIIRHRSKSQKWFKLGQSRLNFAQYLMLDISAIYVVITCGFVSLIGLCLLKLRRKIFVSN